MTTEKTTNKKGGAEFYEALKLRESSGNYAAKNKFGYIGAYQIGEAVLNDLGYYNEEGSKPNYYNNDWSGKFTGKDGINSTDDILNDPWIQDKMIKDYHDLVWSRLKKKGADKYLGKKINGVELTKSGMTAAAHLKGDTSLMNYLRADGKMEAKDAFGTDIMEYITKFGGYDIDNYTPKRKSKLPETKKNVKSIYELLPYHKFTSSSEYFPATGYAAPINDGNTFFATEDIAKMSTDEFLAVEDIINNQIKNKIAIPKSQANMGVSFGAYIYVSEYTRDDGTKVSGYYRRR